MTVEVLLLDVGGTVFDWRTAVTAALAEAQFSSGRVDIDAFGAEWRKQSLIEIEEIASGSAPWRALDPILLSSLQHTLSAFGVEEASEHDRRMLLEAWEAMPAWSEVPDAPSLGSRLPGRCPGQPSAGCQHVATAAKTGRFHFGRLSPDGRNVVQSCVALACGHSNVGSGLVAAREDTNGNAATHRNARQARLGFFEGLQVSGEVGRAAPETVRAQIEAVLRAWRMDEDNIAITSEVMVETDLMGVDSHGISMLLLYDVMQRAGQLRLDARPRLVRESASTALLDGGAGLGHPVSVAATDIAIDKALEHDVGVVSVYNSHHHGALGYYARRIVAKGLVGIVSTTSRLLTVVPTFGADKVLGTNPFCFAAPGGRHDALVLDMSTSVVAANKVKVYAFAGRELPNGWMLDAEGAPLTDAMAAYRILFEGGSGGLTPIGGAGMELGGHKGYGLALFAQVLAGSLGGGSFSPVRNRSQKSSDPDNIGHVFIALNPSAFRESADFRADVDTLIDTMRATRAADPARPVLVPGDPERAARDDRLKNGIPIPPALAEKVREIAESAGAPYLLGCSVVGTGRRVGLS